MNNSIEIKEVIKQNIEPSWIIIEYNETKTLEEMVDYFKNTKFKATLFGYNRKNRKLLYQEGTSLIPRNDYPENFTILQSPMDMF